MKDHRGRNWMEGLISALGEALLEAVEPRWTEHERRVHREFKSLRHELAEIRQHLGIGAPAAELAGHGEDRPAEGKERERRPDRSRRHRRGRSRGRGEQRGEQRGARPDGRQTADRPVAPPRPPAPEEPPPASPPPREKASGPTLVPPPKCKQPGCWRNAFKEGFCKKHHQEIVLRPAQEKAHRERLESTMTVAEYKQIEQRLLEKAKGEREAKRKLEQEAIGEAEGAAAAKEAPAKPKKPAKPARKKAKKPAKKKAKKPAKKAKKPAKKPAKKAKKPAKKKA